MQSLPQETIELVARTYTEGYRKGFEVAGIDLSVKKTVNIRYHIAVSYTHLSCQKRRSAILDWDILTNTATICINI